MFQLEKEMIPILKRDLSRLFSPTHVAEEFVSGNGRPDLVFARASERGSLWQGEALDYQVLHLLVKHLSRKGRVLHVDEVFGASIDKKKTKSIIKTLSSLGFVEYRDHDHIVVRKRYLPAIDEFVSIEAKLSDWKSGTYQAVKYKTFSNSAYLAISLEYLDRVDKEFLKENGIGLISVSNVSAEIVVRAKKTKPKSVVSYYYLSERLVGAGC